MKRTLRAQADYQSTLLRNRRYALSCWSDITE